jgi:ArsR family transcriptional regulator
MHALQVMSALSQPTRYAAFRTLVDALPQGMAAGDVAAAVGSPANNMSAHFAILERAGLITSEKIGRSVVYTADTSTVEELSEFLASACERSKKHRGGRDAT